MLPLQHIIYCHFFSICNINLVHLFIIYVDVYPSKQYAFITLQRNNMIT